MATLTPIFATYLDIKSYAYRYNNQIGYFYSPFSSKKDTFTSKNYNSLIKSVKLDLTKSYRQINYAYRLFHITTYFYCPTILECKAYKVLNDNKKYSYSIHTKQYHFQVMPFRSMTYSNLTKGSSQFWS